MFFKRKEIEGSNASKGFTHAPKMVRGFTLIELLVVVAIIGILSSVVLASLNSARSKGKDAAIKSGLASLRTQVELVADGGDYQEACDGGDTTIENIIANIMKNNGEEEVSCVGDTSSLAVSSPLNSGDSWCLDTEGYAGLGSAGATACDASETEEEGNSGELGS